MTKVDPRDYVRFSRLIMGAIFYRSQWDVAPAWWNPSLPGWSLLLSRIYPCHEGNHANQFMLQDIMLRKSVLSVFVPLLQLVRFVDTPIPETPKSTWKKSILFKKSVPMVSPTGKRRLPSVGPMSSDIGPALGKRLLPASDPLCLSEDDMRGHRQIKRDATMAR